MPSFEYVDLEQRKGLHTVFTRSQFDPVEAETRPAVRLQKLVAILRKNSQLAKSFFLKTFHPLWGRGGTVVKVKVSDQLLQWKLF